MDSPTFFATSRDFRHWLEKYASTARELAVGFYKVDSGHPSLTWSESVDEALCFGWIDGVRRRVDEHSYQIRFTPRKAGSIWSAVNIAKIEQLRAGGRMTAAGEEAFGRRKAERSAIYAYEQAETTELADEHARVFQAASDGQAWAFFQSTPPGYRKQMQHWVASARKPETRSMRLATLIEACAAGRHLR